MAVAVSLVITSNLIIPRHAFLILLSISVMKSGAGRKHEIVSPSPGPNIARKINYMRLEEMDGSVHTCAELDTSGIIAFTAIVLGQSFLHQSFTRGTTAHLYVYERAVRAGPRRKRPTPSWLNDAGLS
jgi:hypothetical protein